MKEVFAGCLEMGKTMLTTLMDTGTTIGIFIVVYPIFVRLVRALRSIISKH